MNRGFVSVVAALVGSAAFAAWPEVSNVTLSQDSRNRVTVSYDLVEDGFVTVDFLTNGVPLGSSCTELTGDFGKLVPAGTRRVMWKPQKDFPGGMITAVQARVRAYHPSCPPDYLAVDLQTGARSYYPDAASLPGGIMDTRYRTTSLLMRRIPAAGKEWTMGCAPNLPSYGGPRQTGHRVVLSNDFYITVFPVTQGQYKEVTGSYNPSSWSLEDRAMLPAESVSYEGLRGALSSGIDWPATGDAVGENSVVWKFRERCGLLLDLPLDAQYEFACRAGTVTDFYTGRVYRDGEDGKSAAAEIGWCYENAESKTHVVGQLLPNGFGLYDMAGNVRSLCRDWYVENLTTLGDRAYFDPVGGLQSEAMLVSGIRRRVSRACHYTDNAKGCSSAMRSPETPTSGAKYIGFRLVCPARNGGAIPR